MANNRSITGVSETVQLGVGGPILSGDNGALIINNPNTEPVPVTGALVGTNFVVVSGDGTPAENAISLQAKYDEAASIVGLSATNRYTIVVGGGYYEFATDFDVDIEFINIVSLTGNKDVHISFVNPLDTIIVMANDIFLKGIDVGASQFIIGDDLSNLRIESCSGGIGSFGEDSITSGTFVGCVGGDNSFGGGTAGQASGTFSNCVAGNNSFGVADGVGGYGYGAGGDAASGTFTNCTGLDNSFGNEGTVTGIFTNCTSRGSSFGNTFTGEIYYCRISDGFSSFPTPTGSGIIRLSIAGNGQVINLPT